MRWQFRQQKHFFFFINHVCVVLQRLYVSGAFAVSVTNKSPSSQGNCLDWSVWKPEQHKIHILLYREEQKTQKREWGTRKVLSVGGKGRWA